MLTKENLRSVNEIDTVLFERLLSFAIVPFEHLETSFLYETLSPKNRFFGLPLPHIETLVYPNLVYIYFL